MAPKIITKGEIEAAQQAWGQGVIDIGRVYQEVGEYVERAGQYVDQLYAYDLGLVLFKPTKAAIKQFRGSREAAISYFVAGNADFPEDHGFALQPWLKVRFENAGIIEGPQALAMGNYYFTGPDGQEVKVEYSFGYIRDQQGNLRINLHHSSLPYKQEH